MIGSAAKLIGIRPADASSGPRLPRALFILLTATLALFYANNAASFSLTTIMVTAKWLPLAGVCIVGLNMLRTRRAPSFPMITAVPLMILLLVSIVGALMSGDPGRSILALLTVVVAAIFGYTVSALVVATSSRRTFFELVANLCRVMVIVALLFGIARVDLSRGGGFGAWADNPNTLALMLAPGMIVFMAGCIERRPGWLTWHAAFFAVGAVIIWYTNARSTVLWLGFSAIAFWVYRRGPALASIGALIVLSIVVGWWEAIRKFLVDELGLNWSVHNIGISPLSGREEVWRVGWQLFKDRPLQGYGFGTTQTLVSAQSWRFRQFQGGHFHSSYIEALVEVGLFGCLALVTLLFFSVGRGVSDASRTKMLPGNSWALSALPFAIIVGAMGHALFESWLLAAGNADAPLFWTCLFLIYHQAQIPIRAVRTAPQGQSLRPYRRGAMLAR